MLTTNLADVGIYQVTVTATIPEETSPGSGVNMSDTFIFQITVDVIRCLDYLQVPLALEPSSSSFEIGASA